jgi:hypothetical protein
MLIAIAQSGWEGYALAFLKLCAVSYRIRLCVGFLCAWFRKKNGGVKNCGVLCWQSHRCLYIGEM